MSPQRTFGDAVRLYGRRRPGLAVGCRAAVPSAGGEVVTVVENVACGVDGLQVRSGCTCCRKNQVSPDHGGHLSTPFDRRNGRGIRVVPHTGFSTARIEPGCAALRERVCAGEADGGELAECDRRLRTPCAGR
ncbi:MAG TPA: FmdE family protein [Methanoregulaceae archaeon]|nr:FmdE family protein [Methanoregulaceae archaeon]